jgi:hypothetical protein
LSLRLIKHDAIKTYGRTEVLVRVFFDTRWRWWPASRPDRPISEERAPGNYYVGGWVSPTTGLDAVEKTKISSPCRESNSGSSV